MLENERAFRPDAETRAALLNLWSIMDGCIQRGFEANGLLPGVLKVWDSQANMVLLRVRDAADTFERLRARKVLIKNVSTMHPLLAQCLRLTVGSAEQNDLLLQALAASL